jgi:hypothetical protein
MERFAAWGSEGKPPGAERVTNWTGPRGARSSGEAQGLRTACHGLPLPAHGLPLVAVEKQRIPALMEHAPGRYQQRSLLADALSRQNGCRLREGRSRGADPRPNTPHDGMVTADGDWKLGSARHRGKTGSTGEISWAVVIHRATTTGPPLGHHPSVVHGVHGVLLVLPLRSRAEGRVSVPSASAPCAPWRVGTIPIPHRACRAAAPLHRCSATPAAYTVLM